MLQSAPIWEDASTREPVPAVYRQGRLLTPVHARSNYKAYNVLLLFPSAALPSGMFSLSDLAVARPAAFGPVVEDIHPTPMCGVCTCAPACGQPVPVAGAGVGPGPGTGVGHGVEHGDGMRKHTNAGTLKRMVQNTGTGTGVGAGAENGRSTPDADTYATTGTDMAVAGSTAEHDESLCLWSLDFDPFKYLSVAGPQANAVAACTAMRMDPAGLKTAVALDEESFRYFVCVVNGLYHAENMYHNDIHALDVAQMYSVLAMPLVARYVCVHAHANDSQGLVAVGSSWTVGVDKFWWVVGMT